MTQERLVIIGAGQAAGQAIASLRAGGYGGAITLVGEEAAGPYQRPPLSKKYLAGEWGMDRVLLKPGVFYSWFYGVILECRRQAARDPTYQCRRRRMSRVASG